MNRKLIIAQILNVVGIGNLISSLLTQNLVSASITRFAFMFSGGIILLSIIMAVVFSIQFLRSIDSKYERCSSEFSPFFKYLLINPWISAFIAISLFGIFLKPEMLKVSFLILLVLGYPVFVFLKSEFLVFNGEILLSYNYGGKFAEIEGNKIVAVKSLQFGLIYKMVYKDSIGKNKTKYFFPRGAFFVFNKPAVVLKLKSFIR